MLEIILVYVLCKKVGDILRGKGRNPIAYQIMAVVFWFGGEFAGAVVGAMVQLASQGPGEAEPGLNLSIYLFALGGAVVGAVLSLIIASVMPSVRDDNSYR